MPLAVTPCLVMCVRQAKQQWCCGGGSRLLVLFPFGVAHELVELFVEVLVTGMAPTVTVCASLLDRVRGVRPPTLSLSVTTCRGLYFTKSNQAFKGAELARGTQETLDALRQRTTTTQFSRSVARQGCEQRSTHACVSGPRIVCTSVEEFKAGRGSKSFRNDVRASASDAREYK